jgi:hypothetical protein
MSLVRVREGKRTVDGAVPTSVNEVRKHPLGPVPKGGFVTNEILQETRGKL